jgi:CBS domain-containing protein
VATIDGSETAASAIAMMRQKKVSSLVVNRRTHEDAWGIVTRKDIVSKVVDPGKDPKTVKVYEIMTKPVVTVSPGLALKYCARLFNNAGIRRAPVFDGKEIVGIISNTDIFNAIEA